MVEQGLVPVDLNNLLIGSNRISAYVRFDNSQYYDFTQVPSDSYVQQYRDKNKSRMFVADVSESLDNVEVDPRDFLNESFVCSKRQLFVESFQVSIVNDVVNEIN